VKSGPGKPAGSATRPAQAGTGGADGQEAEQQVSVRPALSTTSRLTGALLGVHAGDALGATLEFSSWSAVRKQYPDGLTEIIGGGPLG
jgi:ADP-ribosylglycohydrolase